MSERTTHTCLNHSSGRHAVFEHRDYPSAREHSDMPTATADASRRYLRPVQNRLSSVAETISIPPAPLTAIWIPRATSTALRSGSRGGRGHFRVFFRFFTGFALFIFRTGLRLALICQVMPQAAIPSSTGRDDDVALTLSCQNLVVDRTPPVVAARRHLQPLPPPLDRRTARRLRDADCHPSSASHFGIWISMSTRRVARS